MQDVVVFAEATQNNGFAGVAGKGPTPLTYTGDTVTLRKVGKTPVLVALGGASATKPKGVRIKGNRSRNQMYWHGPANTRGYPQGLMTDLAVPFKEGEILTGEADNTNVNENTIVMAFFTYGPPHPWPRTLMEVALMAQAKVVHSVPCTVTPAAAVTPLSGSVALDSASQDDLWIDPDKRYSILGILNSPGLAAGFGVAHFNGLPDPYQGMVPGLPLADLSAIDYMSGGFCPAYEPIGPFPGDGLPNVGLTTGHTNAQSFVLYVAEVA